jgi:hypothetical protein
MTWVYFGEKGRLKAAEMWSSRSLIMRGFGLECLNFARR